MVWNDRGCAAAAFNGGITKQACANAWGSAYSASVAPGDITLQFRCSSKQRTMVGFAAAGNAHEGYVSIDCAMFCDRGILRAYERGNLTWNGYGYEPSDTMSVRRQGSVVTLMQNGKLLRTCARRLSWLTRVTRQNSTREGGDSTT